MMQKVFGGILTVLGIAAILFAAIAFLKGGEALWGIPIDKWETLVPFIVGIIFFTSGIKLINTSYNREKDSRY